MANFVEDDQISVLFVTATNTLVETRAVVVDSYEDFGGHTMYVVAFRLPTNLDCLYFNAARTEIFLANCIDRGALSPIIARPEIKFSLDNFTCVVDYFSDIGVLVESTKTDHANLIEHLESLLDESEE